MANLFVLHHERFRSIVVRQSAEWAYACSGPIKLLPWQSLAKCLKPGTYSASTCNMRATCNLLHSTLVSRSGLRAARRGEQPPMQVKVAGKRTSSQRGCDDADYDCALDYTGPSPGRSHRAETPPFGSRISARRGRGWRRVHAVDLWRPFGRKRYVIDAALQRVSRLR
jgi:hypothetical protein